MDKGSGQEQRPCQLRIILNQPPHMGVDPNGFLPQEVWIKKEKGSTFRDFNFDPKNLWITVDNFPLNHLKFTGKKRCFSTFKPFSPQKKEFYPQLWELVEARAGIKISCPDGREIPQYGQAHRQAAQRARGSFWYPNPAAGRDSARLYRILRILAGQLPCASR